jgi:hypothetical protein
MSDEANFTIDGGQYRVRVRRVPGDPPATWRAQLISTGIGTIMEPAGATPGAALTTLAQDLWRGDAYDRRLAKEIVKYAWFPLRLS